MGADAKRWKTSKTCVYNIGYHIIFCTKYRRKFLTNGVDDVLKELITQKCQELEIELCSMEVMPEHVHIFVKTKPSIAPQYVVAQIKGHSAKIIRDKFPHLKTKAPSLWTRSFYVESVGHISVDTVIKYINDQKKSQK